MPTPTGNNYMDRLNVHLQATKDIKKGCQSFIRSLSETEKACIERCVDETTFHRRRYADGQFYCWPRHAIFKERPTSPWPAVNFPKDVLRADFAVRMNWAEALADVAETATS